VVVVKGAPVKNASVKPDAKGALNFFVSMPSRSAGLGSRSTPCRQISLTMKSSTSSCRRLTRKAHKPLTFDWQEGGGGTGAPGRWLDLDRLR
jgi:hypothetical protein